MFYEIKDKSSYAEISQALSDLRLEVKSIRDLASGNSNSIAQNNLKLDAFAKNIESFRAELDVYRDQTADTREKQIKLQDAISKKRPVIKMPQGPIVFEVMTSDKAELFKGTKKQIKDLSK